MGCSNTNMTGLMQTEEFYSNTIGMKEEDKKDIEIRFMRIWKRLPKNGEWDKFMAPVLEEKKKEQNALEQEQEAVSK